MSKGSKQRPTDKAKFDDGWDRIFGKNELPKGWVCSKCGIDRTKDQCPLFNNVPRMLQECPMVVKAQ
ncbi:MAG: hypothetical protein ACK53Y_20975 [bacterium]